MNKKIPITGTKVEKVIRMDFGEWEFHCCCISPNIGMDEYKEKVNAIASVVASKKKEAVNINAKSDLWESPKKRY